MKSGLLHIVFQQGAKRAIIQDKEVEFASYGTRLGVSTSFCSTHLSALFKETGSNRREKPRKETKAEQINDVIIYKSQSIHNRLYKQVRE